MLSGEQKYMGSCKDARDARDGNDGNDGNVREWTIIVYKKASPFGRARRQLGEIDRELEQVPGRWVRP